MRLNIIIIFILYFDINKMEKYSKDELYSDKYKTGDFIWGQSLGEGKYIRSHDTN